MKQQIIKLPSNRSFGLLFFIVFLIISIWPLSYNGEIRFYSLIISLIFLILGLINSNILKPLNFLWMKFGLLLGKVVSPIILGIIFFFVVTPIGLIMKLVGKDLLNLKYNINKSYWIKKSGPKSKMKNQF
tara:strand:+ start:157 stop:546 length:390 start_codon:yes stop_codon:yes gene_type:complete